MVEGGKRSKTKTRRTGQTVSPSAGSQVIPQQIVPPEEIRTELTTLIQELLLKTHELSFEYSTSDCPEIMSCSLAQKSKELFKIIKRLSELVKRTQQ